MCRGGEALIAPIASMFPSTCKEMKGESNHISTFPDWTSFRRKEALWLCVQLESRSLSLRGNRLRWLQNTGRYLWGMVGSWEVLLKGKRITARLVGHCEILHPGILECVTCAVCLDMLMIVKLLMYTKRLEPKNWCFVDVSSFPFGVFPGSSRSFLGAAYSRTYAFHMFQQRPSSRTRTPGFPVSMV